MRAGATSHVLLGYRATAEEARPVLAIAEKQNLTVSDWLRAAVREKIERDAPRVAELLYRARRVR